MEKNIIFRGKETKLDMWVYGDLLQFNDGDVEIGTHGTYIDDGYHFNDKWDRCFYVDEETIGQFTGLKDCKGVDIYEGDILCETGTGRNVVVEYDAPMFCYKDNDFGYKFLNHPENFCVIGNIHERPDLLEKY